MFVLKFTIQTLDKYFQLKNTYLLPKCCRVPTILADISHLLVGAIHIWNDSIIHLVIEKGITCLATTTALNLV